MKYFQFILCLFLLIPLSSIQAQEAIPFSNIYLEAGGFLQGQILQQDSLGVVSIRLRSGEQIKLKRESISKIKTSNHKEQIHPEGHTTRTQGFYSKLQFGLLAGIRSGDFVDLAPGLELFSFSVGHHFNPHWQIGGGLALDVYDQTFLPLFAEGKFILNPTKRVNWYAGLQTGYSFSFKLDQFSNDAYGGGAMIHPAIGLRFSGKRKSSFLLEVGNRLQWGTIQSWWSASIDRVVYRRLALRLGWEF